MKLTGAEIIMEVLIEQGVTDIFGYPGGTVLNIYEALYNRKMYSEADETVRMFIEKYTSSSMLKDALSLQSKIKAGIAAALEESKKPKKTEHVSEQLQQKNSSQ